MYWRTKHFLAWIGQRCITAKVMSHTEKNCEKIMRKRQKIYPNFLKMIIFLSKLLTKIFSFWENLGHFSVFFLKFSHDLCQCTQDNLRLLFIYMHTVPIIHCPALSPGIAIWNSRFPDHQHKQVWLPEDIRIFLHILPAVLEFTCILSWLDYIIVLEIFPFLPWANYLCYI